MSDLIQQISGRSSRVTLNDGQRLVIETAHGLIEITADIERSHGKHVALTVKAPPDLRWRKGPKVETQLHMKFLEIRRGVAVPLYRMLVAVLDDNEFLLREPDEITVR